MTEREITLIEPTEALPVAFVEFIEELADRRIAMHMATWIAREPGKRIRIAGANQPEGLRHFSPGQRPGIAWTSTAKPCKGGTNSFTSSPTCHAPSGLSKHGQPLPRALPWAVVFGALQARGNIDRR